MPQPYAANLNTAHSDGPPPAELVHASDINALASHLNTLETDANAGGPLDLPGHKATTSTDHDARYARVTHSHTQQWQAGAFALAPVAGDYVIAPRANAVTTLVAFYARQTGGTGATIDVKKNGVTLLTAVLSLTAATTWTAGTLVATPALAIGDTVEFDVVSVAGSPSDIEFSLEGTRTVS